MDVTDETNKTKELGKRKKKKQENETTVPVPTGLHRRGKSHSVGLKKSQSTTAWEVGKLERGPSDLSLGGNRKTIPP